MGQFKVSGFQFYDGDNIIDQLEPGDILELIPEPENEHDENAIMINLGDIKIGYVPMIDNRMLSELLRNDIDLHCVVFDASPNEDPWNRLTVQIYFEGDTFTAS